MSQESTDKGNHEERKFAILVPANNPGHDLCKLVTSALALGYPSPVLINWGKDFRDGGGGAWSAYLAKITGALDYLDKVTRPDTNRGDKLENDDLVLIVDAYDVWFQLPPQTLIQRYHQSCQDGNTRLTEKWPFPSRIPMKETIIAAAQKRCFPTMESGSNLYCHDVPESNLRPDLYGGATDTDSAKQYYHNVRPRFLNSGSFIGPVGDMRQYLRRVKQRMERVIADDLAFEGDQGIFGEVFGEQELWRKWRREQEEISTNNMSTPASKRGSALWQRDFEFHVGLDYSQQLFLPTVYAEYDGDFLSVHNRSFIQSRSSKLGIDPVRLHGVPSDIELTTSTVTEVLPRQVAKEFHWEDVSLYADFYTAAIPALLHHNAWKGGVKNRRTWWWDRMWYFPHLRHILDQRRTKGNSGPVARIHEQGRKVSYYPSRSSQENYLPKVFDTNRRLEGFRRAPLDEVCKHGDKEGRSPDTAWHEEVFRDGRGPV